MKNLFLRSAVALACALSLSACGGDDDGTMQLYGRVFGVTIDGLVLTNKGGSDLVVAAGASTFSFPNLIASNTDYHVEIKSSPTNAKCRVDNGKGKSSTSYGIGQIDVVCTLHPHNVKGKVLGLTRGPLTIINGDYRLIIPANALDFNLTKQGADGKNVGEVGESLAYGLSVLTQPPGQTCVIANAIGIMGKTDVDNVLITCN